MQQVAIQVEYVDKAVAWPCHVIVPAGFGQCVRYVKLTPEVLDVKWRKLRRELIVDKRAAQGGWREVRVKDVDCAGPEVGGIQVVTRPVVADRQSLVDRAVIGSGNCRLVDLDL